MVCTRPLPSHTFLSLGLYFLEFLSASAFCLDSSTFFHKLAILLVTFFLPVTVEVLVIVEDLRVGSTALTGLATFILVCGLLAAAALPLVFRRSMSELEGIRRGARSAAAFRSEWLEEEVRMEPREITEVLEAAEEVLEAELRTAAPRVKEASRSCCVLVVPAMVRAGRAPGLGCTASLRLKSDEGLGAIFGGVFF